MKQNKFIFLLLSIGVLKPAMVMALPFDFGGKLGVEHITWEEIDQAGQISEKDTGARTNLSAFLHSKPEPKSLPLLVYGAEIKVYGGDTDYTSANSGNADYQSTWSGVSLTGEVGLRVGSMPFAWDFVARPAIQAWTYTVDEDLDHTTRTVQAKEEQYTVASLGLGTGPTWRSGKWYGRLIVGVKSDSANVLINSDKSDVYNEDVDIDMDGKTTGFLSFNNSVRVSKNFFVTFSGFYNAYHFKRSDPQAVNTNSGTVQVVIPERKQRNYGVQIGTTVEF